MIYQISNNISSYISAYSYRYLQKEVKKTLLYAGDSQPCCDNTNTVPIAPSYLMVGTGLYGFVTC